MVQNGPYSHGEMENMIHFYNYVSNRNLETFVKFGLILGMLYPNNKESSTHYVEMCLIMSSIVKLL